MAPSWHSRGHRPAGARALLAYIGAWAVVGALAAGIVIALLHDDVDEVSLPPIQETELERASREAGCRLERGGAYRAEPPVEGPRSSPLRAGVYDEEQPASALVGAIRRGAVVISYRPPLSEEDVERLRELQTAVPNATIVAPREPMPYRVVATAWRRMLGCKNLAPTTVDALRLFRGRYVGLGPDAAR